MADSYTLVLDAGTSRAKCLVFDGRGRIAGFSSASWSYLTEPDAPSMARSFDPVSTWRAFCRLIAAGADDAGISPSQVSAVSATSQRQGVVFVDRDGKEVYAGPNLDLRAVFEGGAIDQEMRDAVYRTTGHLPSFFFTPAKLKWFADHRPDSYARIAAVVTLADWLIWRLTGVLASEPTLAAEAGLLDIHRREWCSDLFSEIGTPLEPTPLVSSGDMVGTVSSIAAGETGLAPGTPVAASGADTQCGLLGLGASEKFQTGIVAGWSAPLQMITPRPVLHPAASTWAGCFLQDGKWVLESSPGDLGNSYAWLAGLLYGESEDAFEAMNEAAEAVPAGAEGTVAFLGPTRMDMTDLGVRTGGFLFPVPLTFTEVRPGHLARAGIEAMAYSIRANMEQIECLAEAPAPTIAIGGGMTRTPAFVRALVDVLGREVQVARTPHISALGAYLCARTALGEYASLDEAAAAARGRLQSLEPDALDSAEYGDYYERWVERSAVLRELAT